MMLSMTSRPRFAAVKPQRHCAGWIMAALMLVANAAFAADCDMQLSNREVDYGAINRGALVTGAGLAPISLGKRQFTLNVVCRQPAAMGLRFDGQSAGSKGYRFAGSGNFTVRLSDVIVDGRPVLLTQQPGSGSAAASAMMQPDSDVIVISQGVRAVGKVLSAQVVIDTYIDDATSRVRDAKTLEGYGTFSFVER